MQILLYLVFTLSGAAGLIYESIWSHYLGLFVGHSAYAQIIVLAIFLGGMSLAALWRWDSTLNGSKNHCCGTRGLNWQWGLLVFSFTRYFRG